MADISFDADPLAWLDGIAAAEPGVRWMSSHQLCVHDAEVARSLLRNEDGRLIDHSDFFGRREQALEPRAAQVALAREGHALVQRHLRTLDFGAAVDRLGAESHWPKAGSALLLEMMRPILAKPSRSPAFQAALDRVAHDRILGRHDKPKGRLRRAFDRFRFVSAVLQERRDAEASVPPEDIFDVIASSEGEMSDEALTHIYAAFIFALVGSVGFALGWTVLLAVQHGRTDQRSADLVREALRLYPVAWLLERNPRGEQRIAGELVTPDQSIVISTYAIHRCARYWDRPAEFLPERWHGRIDRTAWLPFGAGPQSCIAASLAIEIASKLLDRIFERKVSLEPGGGGPSTRAALAPPQFVLHRI